MQHQLWGDATAPADRISKAIAIAVTFGGSDCDHHKAWVIDQMVRALTGCPDVSDSATDARGASYAFTRQGESDEYKAIVADAKGGEDGPDTYDWDEGVTP